MTYRQESQNISFNILNIDYLVLNSRFFVIAFIIKLYDPISIIKSFLQNYITKNLADLKILKCADPEAVS